jgi:hypothetical protein
LNFTDLWNWATQREQIGKLCNYTDTVATSKRGNGGVIFKPLILLLILEQQVQDEKTCSKAYGA